MFGKTVTQRIDDLIAVLSLPVSVDEARDGWTDEGKRAIKVYFENVRDALRSNSALPPLDVARGMDSWGVQEGKIFDEAVKIANKLRSK